MKKTLVLLFVLSSCTLLFSQEFTGQKVRHAQWQTNEVLTYSSSEGADQIQMVAVGKKVRRSKDRITHFKINDSSYQLVRHWGVINILDANGNLVLKTDADREEIFSANNERFFKQGNRRKIQYLDDKGQVVVSGVSKNRNIVLKKHIDTADHLLLALCLKELLLFEYEFFRARWTLPLIL